MAKYTTQIKTIVESGVKIFDFDYEIFDPTYKPVLEQKILDYYFFREIGLETVAQFKQFLKAKMNVIMPYYNQFYLSNDVFKTYDPYKNKNVTTTDTRTVTTDGTSESTGTGTSNEVFSDTPQGKLANLDYATNLTENDSNSTENSTSNVTTTENYVSTIAGHDGMKYPTDILTGLRNTFINIDKQIIDELSDLFMNVY